MSSRPQPAAVVSNNNKKKRTGAAKARDPVELWRAVLVHLETPAAAKPVKDFEDMPLVHHIRDCEDALRSYPRLSTHGSRSLRNCRQVVSQASTRPL